MAKDGEGSGGVGEACERLARDPAPERRLDAIRAALVGWRVADESRRASLDAFMLSVANSLDFFARVELADMLAGFGAVPRSLAELLSSDPSTRTILAGVGSARPAAEVEEPAALPKPYSLDVVVELAMQGAFADLAQALARRSARPVGAVRAILDEADAGKLGMLVRHAGYGRTLLAAIATGQQRHGRTTDLLTMMIAYENARVEPAALRAGAR